MSTNLEPPSVQRIAELQQLIADFSSIQRALNIADKGRPENDVEHSYGLALTCWFIAPKIAPHLDMQKILMYALAHDLVELHAGDTYVFDSKAVETKPQREDEALERLAIDWPDFTDMVTAAKDYKDKKDAEAKFVYVIDKMLPPILINLGEKDAYWKKHNITKQMHDSLKHKAMMASPEASIYYEKLVEWLENPNYFHSEEAG
jgi:putative hydrolases of HD superfamily